MDLSHCSQVNLTVLTSLIELEGGQGSDAMPRCQCTVSIQAAVVFGKLDLYKIAMGTSFSTMGSRDFLVTWND